MSEPDLSEFEKLSRPRGAGCKFPAARDQLKAEDRDKLDAALSAPVNQITNAAISQWMARRDVKIAWQSIRSHRDGACSCDG